MMSKFIIIKLTNITEKKLGENYGKNINKFRLQINKFGKVTFVKNTNNLKKNTENNIGKKKRIMKLYGNFAKFYKLDNDHA